MKVWKHLYPLVSDQATGFGEAPFWETQGASCTWSGTDSASHSVLQPLFHLQGQMSLSLSGLLKSCTNLKCIFNLWDEKREKKKKRRDHVNGAHLHKGSTWEEVCKSVLFSSSSVLFSKKIPSEILFRKESLSNTGNDSAFKVASTCPKSREISKIQLESALKALTPSYFQTLYLIEELLARVCVPNRPLNQTLPYTAKMEHRSARTELYWSRHLQVLSVSENTVFKWSGISSGHLRIHNTVRSLTRIAGFCLFARYLPTTRSFKLCFSSFLLTRCIKGWT